jgi:ketosteroid isomerase-like protein
MKLLFLSAFLLAILRVWAAPCEQRQAKDEKTLLRLEQTWARALERQDAEAVGCLLADEFEDADVDGRVQDRKQALARISQRRPSRNHLQDLRAHIYEDLAFVRGLNQVTDTSGKTLLEVRFTDIFVYRDGRWQALAGQETQVKP